MVDIIRNNQVLPSTWSVGCPYFPKCCSNILEIGHVDVHAIIMLCAKNLSFPSSFTIPTIRVDLAIVSLKRAKLVKTRQIPLD